MAENNPPGFLQNAGATHTAEQMRNWHGLYLAAASSALALTPRGGVHPGLGNGMITTQTGSPSMAVIVKSGHAMVTGTEGAKQGAYAVMNDADVTLSISAAHATLNRIDIVCFKVQDTAYSGGVNSSSLVVVTGTPASSPVAPSAPVNAITLCSVFIGAAVTSILNANITDLRPILSSIGGPISVAGLTERNALAAYAGLAVYRRDTGNVEVYNGSVWTVFVVGAGDAWVDWSATFSIASSGTQPTKGNSTYASRYKLVGKTCHFTFGATIGSTYAAGTGNYQIPVPFAPFTPANIHVGRLYIQDNGTALLSGSMFFNGASDTFLSMILQNNTGGLVSASGPGTVWATGDTIEGSITYDIA